MCQRLLDCHTRAYLLVGANQPARVRDEADDRPSLGWGFLLHMENDAAMRYRKPPWKMV